jgi:Na+-translocating ferredoxin:NAD+ oxidoreductase RnfD subunit
MIEILLIVGSLAAISEGVSLVAPRIAIAAASAAIIDAVAFRLRNGAWSFPDGGLLTGLFVAMVLSSHESMFVVGATAAIGVLSKYVLRTRFSNVFNPAALGLVVSFYLFGAEQSWWGALPEPFALAIAVLLITGVYIADRINKMPLVLSFLGSYFLLFTLTAFYVSPRTLTEIFQEPDLQAALFFAFFILTDPPTSPIPYGDQAACGAIVALSSYIVFQTLGAAHYLLSGVLVGNVYEAIRRRYRKGAPIDPVIAYEQESFPAQNAGRLGLT